MKLLVTGAAGCIGRAVVQRALGGGHVVRAVARRAPAATGGAIEWREADLELLEGGAWRDLVSGCDAVVHLAALVHRPAITDPSRYRRANVEVTTRLLEAARAAGLAPGRFVLSSTVGVYGRDHDLAADEDTPVAPRTPYAASKLEAERAVRAGGGVVLRFPVVYGAGDRGNVGQLVRAIARGAFALPGPCAAPRSLLASANAAAAIVQALERGVSDATFLVTDDDDRSVRALAECIATAVDPPVSLRRVPYALVWGAAALGTLAGRAGLPTRVDLDALRKLTTPLTFSCARARASFGYIPELGFEPAVRAAVADALRAGSAALARPGD